MISSIKGFFEMNKCIVIIFIIINRLINWFSNKVKLGCWVLFFKNELKWNKKFKIFLDSYIGIYIYRWWYIVFLKILFVLERI